jgi:hypothetical protein
MLKMSRCCYEEEIKVWSSLRGKYCRADSNIDNNANSSMHRSRCRLIIDRWFLPWTTGSPLASAVWPSYQTAPEAKDKKVSREPESNQWPMDFSVFYSPPLYQLSYHEMLLFLSVIFLIYIICQFAYPEASRSSLLASSGSTRSTPPE